MKPGGEWKSLRRFEPAPRRDGLPFDAARVQHARAAIASGAYKVDAALVAARLLELELRLS